MSKSGQKHSKNAINPALAKKIIAARVQAEEDEKQKIEQEEIQRKKFEEEAEAERLRQAKIEEEKAKKKQEKERLKKEGLLKTKNQLLKEEKDNRAKEQLINAGLIHAGNSEGVKGLPCKKKKNKARELSCPKDLSDQVLGDHTLNDSPAEPLTSAISHPPPSQPVLPDLKCPVVCVLGHVDTGKTTLLDKIRSTHVQSSEPGGITQQIGVTLFPKSDLAPIIEKLPNKNLNIQIPGLLIIDTPGHEPFSSLRDRGSNLCDLAVLVVDLMHGLEETTVKCLDMLIEKNIPFIVALNKIDRLYSWSAQKDESFLVSFQSQQSHVHDEFEKKLNHTVLDFAQKGLNAGLYYSVPDSDYIHLVPTSAKTGEGIPDLLASLIELSQTKLAENLRYSGELKASVMEVKATEGFGTTIDVILSDGCLKEGDKITLFGYSGSISTTIRSLLTPMPLREMRVKGEYIHHKIIYASAGVKIAGHNLETAMPGSPILVSHSEEELSLFKSNIISEKNPVFESINSNGEGLHVQASTIGALEGVLTALNKKSISVSSYNIGPVLKKDVMKAQRQVESLAKKEYATVIAFDVKVMPDARKYAKKVGVKIMESDIIDHVYEKFLIYAEEIWKERKMKEGREKGAVLPCLLRVEKVVKKEPLVLAVEVVRGVLSDSAPLCLFEKGKKNLGPVRTLEINRKPAHQARKKDSNVTIKLTPVDLSDDVQVADVLASTLTLQSNSVLNAYFGSYLEPDDWELVKYLTPAAN